MPRRPFQESLWRKEPSHESWLALVAQLYGNRTGDGAAPSAQSETGTISHSQVDTIEQLTRPTFYDIAQTALQVMVDRYGTEDFQDTDIKDMFLLTDYIHENSGDDRLFYDYATQTWPKLSDIFQDDMARAIYSEMSEDDLDLLACVLRVVPDRLSLKE